jgi:hypothetical protein
MLVAPVSVSVLVSVELIVITPFASVVTLVAPEPLMITLSVPEPLPPAVKFIFTLPFAEPAEAAKS